MNDILQIPRIEIRPDDQPHLTLHTINGARHIPFVGDTIRIDDEEFIVTRAKSIYRFDNGTLLPRTVDVYVTEITS